MGCAAEASHDHSDSSRRAGAGSSVARLPARAETHLRIGIGDDPDALDPTTSRTYTARIVFASLCDKLFDIDDKLNIIPQLG